MNKYISPVLQDNEQYCSKFVSLGRLQKTYFFSPFQKAVNLQWIFTTWRQIIDKIWLQISLKLSTQDSEYLVCFSKLHWEHCKPDPNYQVVKIFVVFGCFFNIWLHPTERKRKKALFKLLQRDDFSKEHFDIKLRPFL